jgi:hypothetical protein
MSQTAGTLDEVKSCYEVPAMDGGRVIILAITVSIFEYTMFSL